MEDVVDEVLDAPDSENEEQCDINTTKNNDEIFDNIFPIKKGKNVSQREVGSSKNIGRNCEKNISLLHKKENAKMNNSVEPNTKSTLSDLKSQSIEHNKTIQPSPDNIKKVNCGVIIASKQRINQAEKNDQEADHINKHGSIVENSKVVDVENKLNKNGKGKKYEFVRYSTAHKNTPVYSLKPSCLISKDYIAPKRSRGRARKKRKLWKGSQKIGVSKDTIIQKETKSSILRDKDQKRINNNSLENSFKAHREISISNPNNQVSVKCVKMV